jgi:hypothetical protein
MYRHSCASLPTPFMSAQRLSILTAVHNIALYIVVDELCVVLWMFVSCGYGY